MGQLEELNDLIETNAPYIHECAGEFPLYEGASKDGIVYGITPVGSTYGSKFCYFGRADLLKDIEIDENKLYGYDDLEKVFAAMKAKAPDTAPLAVQGSDIKPTASYSAQFIDKMDILGATVQSGVLIGDSTTIVNLFETDEYMEYLRHMRDWYNKGYILKEAATSDDLKLDLMMSGRTSGYMIKNTPMQLGNAYRDYGIEFKSMQVTSLYNASTASTANYYWTIPITCERPDKAMQFLNMTYENEAIVNLIQNGIEGKHYVKTENPGIVRFSEGVDTATNGFYNPLGLYGDKRKAYYWEPTEADIVERNEAYTMEALANPTIAVGYNYDASAMTNQLTAISNVLAEYLPSLETGSVDPDKVMPEFLEKLKSAGIDEVIADNQSQFDQWLKENGK